jgi:uncharacterized protein (TIGR02246 family)
MVGLQKTVIWTLLVFSVFSATAIAQNQTSPLVVGETFTIDSRIMGEKRVINVYMPPGYKESPAARFPVLYMPDGGIAEDFLHVAGLVQVSVGNETMRPFLLVGIENTERRRDMTGPTENENDKKIARRVGGSAAFRNFIRDELMPQIKARYRATDEKAIVGESLAGLFVVETFFLEPDLFDTYIAFDPSLWWNNQKLVSDAAARLRARPELKKTLYFANSSDAIEGVAQKFADVLGKNAPAGVRWHFEKMPEEKHSTIYHPAALKAFRAVFKPVIVPDTPASSQNSADSMPNAAPQASDSEMTKVRRAIDAGNAVWVAAWAKGDAAMLPDTFTPDGKEFVAGGKIYQGRKEILALMRDSMQKRGGKAKLTVTTTDVWLDGDTAYETGTAVYEFTIDGQPKTLERRYFTVWKRQSKRGAWKIFLNTGVAKQ